MRLVKSMSLVSDNSIEIVSDNRIDDSIENKKPSSFCKISAKFFIVRNIAYVLLKLMFYFISFVIMW